MVSKTAIFRKRWKEVPLEWWGGDAIPVARREASEGSVLLVSMAPLNFFPCSSSTVPVEPWRIRWQQMIRLSCHGEIQGTRSDKKNV